jgi:ethanolamine ammonia-lyase large subunit
MKPLTPVDQIPVPSPPADEIYRVRLFDQDYSFVGLKSLLGAADFSKAGDRGAALAAPTEVVREAARAILSSLTLEHIYDRPLTDDDGRVDSVMRVGYDVDLGRFRRMASWTVGQLKDYLLEAPGDETGAAGLALTPVIAAAVCKLMDTHDLILAARKIHRVTKARTTLGLAGTLSSRCQPNHPWMTCAA